MPYHSEGTLTLTNDEGKTTTYKICTYGDRLVIYNSDGKWEYVTDKPPVLVERLTQDIEDLKEDLAQKQKCLKELQKACK